MKLTSFLAASAAVGAVLAGAAAPTRAQEPLAHPSTSVAADVAVVRLKGNNTESGVGPVAIVTDLDLGAADAGGRVGQEIIVLDFQPTLRIRALGPDGSTRFNVTP
jgi:hypothetical protein